MASFTKIAIAVLLLGACANTPTTSEQEQSNRLAKAAAEGGNLGSAIQLYREQLEAKPKDFATTMNLAQALYQAGATNDALAVFKAAAKIRDYSPGPWVGMGRVSLAQGRPHEAHQYFVRAVARDEKDYAALTGVAVSRDHMGAHEESQDIYRRLLEIRPNDPSLLSNLGLSLALGGQAEQAIHVLLQITSAPNAPAPAQHNLALAYALAGKEQLAKQVWGLELSTHKVENNLRLARMMRATP